MSTLAVRHHPSGGDSMILIRIGQIFSSIAVVAVAGFVGGVVLTDQAEPPQVEQCTTPVTPDAPPGG
jgi:hypothetical protein